MKHLSLLFLLVFTNSFLFSQTLQISLTGTSSVGCFGQNDGAVQVSVTGGTLPYSFSWNLPGLSGDSVSNLAAGIYIVTVTDAFSSSIADTFTILNPPAIQLSFTTTLAYPEYGSATVTASGGVPPYTCEWPQGDTTFTATDLYPGVYVCTVTDANGCTQEGIAYMETLSPIIYILTDLHYVTCFGGNDGGGQLWVQGGQPPYTFLWSNGDTSQTLINVPEGNYECTITDILGGTAIATATFFGPPQINFNYDTTHATSNLSNGTININAISGGQGAPYTCLWSTGETSLTITGLAAGIYTCTISDHKGCTITETIVLDDIMSVVSHDWAHQISISPNPAHDRCTIEWPGTYPVKIIQLYNNQGSLVFQNLTRQMNTYSFSTSNYPPGIYQIGLVSESGNIILKPLVIGE